MATLTLPQARLSSERAFYLGTGAATTFDFGEWKSEVASRRNPDGSLSFLTTAPGISGFEFVVGPGPGPSLIVRDAQHESVFAAR